MTSFSRRKASLSKARTAELSWLHVSNKCTNVIILILPSFPFLVATVICHGRSLLQNQSVWLSLNFFCRYFIARSKTSDAEVSSSSSMRSGLDSSWFVERSKCAFQEFMHCLNCKVTKAKSSFLSVVPPTSYTALSIYREIRADIPTIIWNSVGILGPSPSLERWNGQIVKAFISYALM